MSDETIPGTPKLGALVDDKPMPPVAPTIIISLQRGQVNVNGPLDNEPLCLWMLHKAGQIIEGYNLDLALRAKNKGIIAPIKPGLMS